MTKTFEKPARGRKQCKGCGKYVAARTSICVCGSRFPVPVRVKKKQQSAAASENTAPTTRSRKDDDIEMASRCKTITVPAGPCPVPLLSTDRTAIQEWAIAVLAEVSKGGDAYSLEALEHFARQFYPSYTSEWKLICSVLREELAAK